jgi:cysteine desulfurase/selenocysteine lyase
MSFPAHKLYGPTGIGVLWGRADLLDAMPPWQGGGSMIDRVTFETHDLCPAPTRFEAGTPAIIEAIGLAAAIDYVEAIGIGVDPRP